MSKSTTPTPILLYSDNPALSTGLARITRHLAILLSRMPEFRVGTFGRGGISSRKLTWTQYCYPESAEWGQDYLPVVWENFAGETPGIIFTIMDAVRMHWFSRPQYIKSDGPLKELLESKRFKRWGYFPIDHTAANGMLSEIGMDAVMGYDRHLAYTMFGADILTKITGEPVTWLPHGLNFDIFRPRGREGIRFGLGVPKGATVVGVVATNQVRKDWGMAAAVVHELKMRGRNVVFWACIDDPIRHWNIHALLKDYEIADQTLLVMGSQLNDETLAHYYSMCDVTFLPTMGEGFGYPVVESMACGTPCVTVNYAGAAELVPREWLIEPRAFRIEAPLNSFRPVTDVGDWADALTRVIDSKIDVQDCVRQVEHLNWMNLSAPWKRWFVEGLQ